MKRKRYALAAGILPFMAAIPLPTAAKVAPGTVLLDVESASAAATRGTIAGFPTMAPTRIAQAKPPKDTKPTKPTKCPPSPSKPTKKCK